MNNKDHILTAKQEKLISRLAMLSSSRKGYDKVYLSFFVDGANVLMVAPYYHSIMLVSNNEICTKNLLEGYEGFASITASSFRISSCFNKLGKLHFIPTDSIEDNNTAYLISKANCFQRINFEEDNTHLRKLDKDEVYYIRLPKRLHSVFKNADCYRPDAKTIAVKTCLDRLNILYFAEVIP